MVGLIGIQSHKINIALNINNTAYKDDDKEMIAPQKAKLGILREGRNLRKARVVSGRDRPDRSKAYACQEGLNRPLKEGLTG